MGENSSHGTADANDTDWYWDLNKKLAVPASDRGAGDHTLGPYESKAEAENWKATSANRNDIWDTADDNWNEPASGDH